jgi:hypothetical protein
MIARERRAPVVKHAQELARIDVRTKLIFRHVRKTKSRQNRVQAEGNIVEDRLSFRADLHLTSALCRLRYLAVAKGEQRQALDPRPPADEWN